MYVRTHVQLSPFYGEKIRKEATFMQNMKVVHDDRTISNL